MADIARITAPTFRYLTTPSSSSSFRSLAAISTSISRYIHASFLSLKHSLSPSSTKPLNHLITSTILLLAAFLQLKYNDSSSPFSTHPKAMNIAVSCAILHYLASAAVLRFQLHRTSSLAAHHLSLSSAYVSIASLLAPLLSDPAAPFVYALFGSLSAAELLCFLHLLRLHLVGFEFRTCPVFSFFDSTYGQWPRRLPI